MVNAGLLKATVVDEAIAAFWQQILTSLSVRRDIVVRAEDDIGWRSGKTVPKLLALLNPIVAANRQGTVFGNEVFRRYLQSTAVVKNATSEAELKKFRQLLALFQKYAAQYELDYVLMLAQGYQDRSSIPTRRAPPGRSA
jgi:membrane-bound lytic murein transglycosylase MltF